MFAEVRRLRAAGRRLSRDEIKGQRPLRGRLMVFRRNDPWQGSSVAVASLVGEDLTTYLLPPLDQVRLLRWRGRDLILAGLEDAGTRKSRAVDVQSWWVHLLREEPDATVPGGSQGLEPPR